MLKSYCSKCNFIFICFLKLTFRPKSGGALPPKKKVRLLFARRPGCCCHWWAENCFRFRFSFSFFSSHTFSHHSRLSCTLHAYRRERNVTDQWDHAKRATDHPTRYFIRRRSRSSKRCDKNPATVLLLWRRNVPETAVKHVDLKIRNLYKACRHRA